MSCGLGPPRAAQRLRARRCDDMSATQKVRRPSRHHRRTQRAAGAQRLVEAAGVPTYDPKPSYELITQSGRNMTSRAVHTFADAPFLVFWELTRACDLVC